MKKRLIGSLLFGALIVSSSSVFVSCADYDDDINANKAEIQAVQTELNKLTSDLTALQNQLTSTKNDLQNELTAAKSEFETKIAAAKAELQDAINTKADQSTVDALSTKLANLETAYTAKVASLEAQIAQINASLDAINNLIAQKADKSELTAAIATLQAAIDKKVDTETYNQAVALLQELKTNLSNLQTLVDTKASKEYVDSEVTKLNATITALQAALDGKVAATEFAALKSTVDAIQDAVKALQTAAANAATKDELNSVKSELNAAIAKLQEQINGYVTTEKLDAAINTLKIELQAAIDALKEGKADKADVAAMAVQIAGLEAVVANMLTQSDLDLLREQLTQLINTNDANINAKVDELIAALEAVVAANEEASENADAQLAAAIAALEASTNQSVANLQDKDAALQALIDALTANAANLQSQIDDLKANKADKAALDAAVADLTEAKTNISLALAAIAGITGDIETINANYAALIAQIANTDAATDASIAALNTKIEGLENGKVAANAAAIAALQVQNNAIAAFLGELTEGGLAGQLEALKQAMSAEAQAKLNAEIADRVAAINEVVGKINDVKSDLASLDSKLYDPATGDITTLKAQFSTIDQKIQNGIDENLAALKLFVVRMLSSITLIPDLYIGGIEAISFESLQYVEVELCNDNGVHNAPTKAGVTGNHVGDTPNGPTVEPNSKNQSIWKVFGWTHIANTKWNYLGNEEASAQYRVSPAHLDEETFIKDQIEVVANTAFTRADLYNRDITSPVEVVKDRTTYNKETGVVQIYLKKTAAFQGKDLNADGLYQRDAEGNIQKYDIWTVSLRVPRNPNYVPTTEDGEAIAKYVYSEFARLDEIKMRPYIAEKFIDANGNYQWRYNNNYHHTYYSNRFTNEDANGNKIDYAPFYGDRSGWGAVRGIHNQKAPVAANFTQNDAHQHYLDSATIFRSYVDDDQYVKAELLYSQEHELNKMVTACYDPQVARTQGEKVYDRGNHSELNAEKLKQFGLAFRFAIPAVYYGLYYIQDVDHNTNNNLFAKISYDPNTGKSYIRSTYAKAGASAGWTPETNEDWKVDVRNAASVGKEPIVRICLVDTVNNRLVDQRYMKIKWKENLLDDVTLDPKESNDKVDCYGADAYYTWSEFIENVYAKIKNDKVDMSEATFRSIYKNYSVELKKNQWDTPVWNDKANRHLEPVFFETGNLNGDALIGRWSLTADDIRRIFKGDLEKDHRTFTAEVKFISSVPTEHPSLKFTWTFNIYVPKLPEINGFYNNYWLDESTHSLHYVLPVQYGTPQYKKLGDGEIAYAAEPNVQNAHPATAPTPDGYVPGYNVENNYLYYYYTQHPGELAAGDVADNYKVPYCVFDNNLMNAFSYNVAGNVTRFIVKNIYDGCQSWDIQFRPDQQQSAYRAGWHKSGYKTSDWNSGYTASAGVDYEDGIGPKSNANGMFDWEPDTTTVLGNRTHATCDVTNYTKAVTPTYKLYKEKRDGYQNKDNMAARLIWLQGHSQWDNNANYKNANLVVDHINRVKAAKNEETLNNSMVDLLNKLQDDNEDDGWTPLKTNEKQIRMAVWGTINRWNHVPVWLYNIALVEPIRLNAKLEGVFEDGWVSGTAVPWEQAMTLTDFRGYLVRKTAPSNDELKKEQTSYTDKLFKYYEIGEPVWDVDNTRYGFIEDGGSIKAKDGLDWNSAMTSARIKTLTNGNIDLSIYNGRLDDGRQALIFKNNGGSNVETQVDVFIPVKIDYGFGTLERECKVRLYKKGTADQNKIVPGPTAPARQK